MVLESAGSSGVGVPITVFSRAAPSARPVNAVLGDGESSASVLGGLTIASVSAVLESSTRSMPESGMIGSWSRGLSDPSWSRPSEFVPVTGEEGCW